jgi:hypothetical protein
LSTRIEWSHTILFGVCAMIATAAPPVVNRIAGYAPAPRPPVPATPEGKKDAWSDALFAAMMFYQSQLSHPDPDVAERAASAIFDLEKTRLRHGRELAEASKEAPRPNREDGPKMPTKADVERLGQIAKLALQFDDEDDFDEVIPVKRSNHPAITSSPGPTSTS